VKREAPPPPAAETKTAEVAWPPAAPVLVNGLMKHTLPNGVVIDVAPDGVERKCIAFIEDKSKPVDKNLWFDFDRLYFQTGSATLTAESKAQVQAMVEVLRAYPASAIKIGGYTDNVGDPDFNLKLSDARAERVMKEFIALGIAPDRLEWEGYGEQHPQADNATEEGRAKNRRTAVSVRRK
jgi:outer membrane protein OmpA-like peptidoglycan-associated protein